MQLGFYFDQSRCTGCQACQVACKDWNDVPPGPAAWLRVQLVEEGKYPDVSVRFLLFRCFHCESPACIPACPAGALSKRADNGIVLIDQNTCNGCNACRDACPYPAPQFRRAGAPMEKCDFCRERIEAGLKPVCVAACPQRALDYGPLDTLSSKYPLAVSWTGGYPEVTIVRPSLLIKPRPKK